MVGGLLGLWAWGRRPGGPLVTHLLCPPSSRLKYYYHVCSRRRRSGSSQTQGQGKGRHERGRSLPGPGSPPEPWEGDLHSSGAQRGVPGGVGRLREPRNTLPSCPKLEGGVGVGELEQPSAPSPLCDLEPAMAPLWASASPSVKWGPWKEKVFGDPENNLLLCMGDRLTLPIAQTRKLRLRKAQTPSWGHPGTRA